MIHANQLGERLTPNFLLLWQSDAEGLLHADIPRRMTGGNCLRGEEQPWEIVGLYHDKDEAFEALSWWDPGPRRGAGQVSLMQLSGTAYANYDADSNIIVAENLGAR
jgi:hypothetical protein